MSGSRARTLCRFGTPRRQGLGLLTDLDITRSASLGDVEPRVVCRPSARTAPGLEVVRDPMDGAARTTTVTARVSWRL